MNRLLVAGALAGTAFLAACGGGEVIVQAQDTTEDGAVSPIAGLPVRALPYDRDAIFDSLRSAYSVPEPEIPADLAALQDSMSSAQIAWTNATARWNTGRDSLQNLNRRLSTLPRASGEYIVLFRQFNDLEGQVAQAERTMNAEFNRFTSMQSRFANQAEATRIAREQWADAAYADVDLVIAEKLKQLRLGEAADTTDGNGMAQLGRLKAGEYWIHARHDLVTEELYWNIPVTISGEQQQVQLTRATAQVRPKL